MDFQEAREQQAHQARTGPLVLQVQMDRLEAVVQLAPQVLLEAREQQDRLDQRVGLELLVFQEELEGQVQLGPLGPQEELARLVQLEVLAHREILASLDQLVHKVGLDHKVLKALQAQLDLLVVPEELASPDRKVLLVQQVQLETQDPPDPRE
jgi:hypothetical protein